MTFQIRLSQSKPILLDGATGSELEARGVKTALPFWSTIALLTEEGRKILRTIHLDYILAGAEIITANTFRTNHRTLKKENMESRAGALTFAAVEEVRHACDAARKHETVFIAGSVAPVEDCYSPPLVPTDQELRDEHRRHIDNLYAAKVDVILIETMNTIREAVIALDYAKQTGLPVIVSFISKDEEHILSGEDLEKAVDSVAAYKPQAVMVNCVPVHRLEKNFEILKDVTSLPIGGYANIVAAGSEERLSGEDYARYARAWLDKFQLKIIGGCCGTAPEHIQSIAEII